MLKGGLVQRQLFLLLIAFVALVGIGSFTVNFPFDFSGGQFTGAATGPRPDLVVSNISFSHSFAFEGDRVAMHVTTRNDGSMQAANSITRILFNASTRDYSIPPLGPGQEQENSLDFVCGSSNMAFNATADFFNQVAESNENNNFFLKSFLCLPREGPDLIISSLRFSKNPAQQGDNITVFVATKNVGNARASASAASIQFESERKFFPIPLLNVGAVEEHLFDYTCGSFNVSFVASADYFNNVTELIEGNNVETSILDCVG